VVPDRAASRAVSCAARASHVAPTCTIRRAVSCAARAFHVVPDGAAPRAVSRAARGVPRGADLHRMTRRSPPHVRRNVVPARSESPATHGVGSRRITPHQVSTASHNADNRVGRNARRRRLSTQLLQLQTGTHGRSARSACVDGSPVNLGVRRHSIFVGRLSLQAEMRSRRIAAPFHTCRLACAHEHALPSPNYNVVNGR
jgi:hypothetical protein